MENLNVNKKQIDTMGLTGIGNHIQLVVTKAGVQ